MPRIARKDLNTQFLHVMVQGVNKEYIFYKKEYIEKYLKLIKENIEKFNITIMSYCIMGNHAHFLIYVENIDELGKFMHKVNLLYSKLYNKYEKRCGVLFRNRYQTEPIYNKKYLVNCIKYIHENPVKAKMVDKCSDYEFSSYNEFLINGEITKTEIMKKIFGSNCNYKKLFDKIAERRFIDMDNDNNSKEYILNGIKEFCKEYTYSLSEIFSHRDVLRELIIYLNQNCMIKFIEIQKFLEVSKCTLNNLKK